MFIFLVLFLTLVKTAHKQACIGIAMSLHALLLAQFVSMAAQSIFIIERLVLIFSSNSAEIIKKISVVSIFGESLLQFAKTPVNLPLISMLYAESGLNRKIVDLDHFRIFLHFVFAAKPAVMRYGFVLPYNSVMYGLQTA